MKKNNKNIIPIYIIHDATKTEWHVYVVPIYGYTWRDIKNSIMTEILIIMAKNNSNAYNYNHTGRETPRACCRRRSAARAATTKASGGISRKAAAGRRGGDRLRCRRRALVVGQLLSRRWRPRYTIILLLLLYVRVRTGTV